MQDIKARLAGGVVWLALARGLVSLIAFGSTIALARLLAPADFGLVAIATTLLAIVTAVTELSLAQALVHHKDPTETHFHAAFSLNLLRGAVVGLVFLAAAWPVAAIYADERLVAVMIVLGLSFVVNGAANPKMILFQKELVFRQEFVSLVAQKLAGVCVSVGIALVHPTYWALVLGVVAQQATMVAISYLYVPFRPRLSLAGGRELWSFSVWLTLGQAINTMNWKFDQLLVGAVLGKTALGHYTVGDNLASIPTREATAPLTRTLFPAFAHMRGEGDRLRAAYQAAQVTVSAVALPVAVGCALVAEPLVRLAMGEAWLPSVPVIQVLSCVFGLQTLGAAVQPLAMARGETRLLFKRDALTFGLRLPTVIAGLWLGGLPGLILARALTGSLGLLINMDLVRRILGVSVGAQIAANGRTLLATGVMAAAVLAAESAAGPAAEPLALAWRIALFVAVGALAYGAASLLSWIAAGYPPGLESEVRRVLRALAARLRGRREARA